MVCLPSLPLSLPPFFPLSSPAFPLFPLHFLFQLIPSAHAFSPPSLPPSLPSFFSPPPPAGILSIGQSIENPYAWDTFDIDFEGFAIQLSRDLSTIANCLQDDRAAFLKELVHPHEEEEGGREG